MPEDNHATSAQPAIPSDATDLTTTKPSAPHDYRMPKNLKYDKPTQRRPINLLDIEQDDIWARLPNETNKAYGCFLIYRRLDPLERSQNAVVKRTKHGADVISRWALTWHWKTRAAAWDHHLDKLESAKTAKARARATQRQLETSEAMHQRVATGLQGLTKARAKKMTPHEIANLSRTAVFVERLALGMATEHTSGTLEHSGEVGVSGKILHGHINLDRLSDEKLRLLESLIDEATENTTDEGGYTGDLSAPASS